MPLWADDPRLLVAKLEATAEGCRWLLERWAEYRNLLDHRSIWQKGILLRFIRLQGKDVVESVYDPALNSIFLAWDVLFPTYAKEAWDFYRDDWPRAHPALNHWVTWREIAPRPSEEAEAWAVLYAIVAEHIGRLKQLLAHNQVIEAAADPTWADRAVLDCSAEFERHRRYQSAKTRELLRTLETLRKMRNGESGMRNGESEIGNGEGEMANGKCQMADGKCQVADDRGRMAIDECQMADEECRVAEGELPMVEGELPMTDEQCEMESGGWAQRESSEPMAEGSSGPVAGDDPLRALDDSTDDKVGILSHEGADAVDRTGQGDGVGQSLPGNLTTPQKAPNEANLESTQSTSPLGVESQNTETAGHGSIVALFG